MVLPTGGIFKSKRLIHPHRHFSVFPEQRKSNFHRIVQSTQFILNFIERALRKWNSCSAQITPSDSPLQEQCDDEGRGDRGRGSWGLWSRGRGRECGARVFRLVGEGAPNSCPSIESGRSITTGVMAPEIDVRMDSSLAGVALESGFLATEDGVEAERDRLLEKLNRFEMENEQLKKSLSEEEPRMKVISTCLVDTEKRVATLKTER